MAARSRVLLPLLLALGCQRQVAQERRAPGPIDTGSLRPLTLQYRGAHRGEHRPWFYTAHMRIQPETYAGQPAWRNRFRIQHIGPDLGPPPEFESTTVLHRDTLALLEAEDVYGGSFGASRTRMVSRNGRLVGQVEEGERRTPIDIDAPGFVVRDLDLLLMSLPLRVGYRSSFAFLDDGERKLRRFSIAALRRGRVRVPAGEFDALHVAVTPLDGNQRMATTCEVRVQEPRIVLRKQYVVNPATVGPIKRSVGTEELVSIGD